MWRRQLPVHSPVRPLALARAAGATVVRRNASRSRVAALLVRRYTARDVVLTDSGTSALVLALRLAAGDGGTVAFPGYGCIDLAAAAVRAGVRVRLYDLDPATLSPELESVEQAIRRGVDAVLVAHLYGYPADIVGVAELAARAGVSVVEDAAQGSGGTLFDAPLGGYGPLAVLSFGRGKGVTGGGGGALLVMDRWLTMRVRAGQRPGAGGSGVRELAVASAHWMLGRPSLYRIPASIPALRLGEMVYRPAHEPRAMSPVAATLVRSALAGADGETATRRRHARELEASIVSARGLGAVHAIPGGRTGYLRLPVIDFLGREPAPALGIVRGYPGTLVEQAALRRCLHHGETAPTGAALLGRSLFTLPTHGLLAPSDVVRIRGWIEAWGHGRNAPMVLTRADHVPDQHSA